MRSNALPLTAFVAAAWLSGPALAGVYLESSHEDLSDPKATGRVSKMWFDGGRMRSESGQGDIALFKNRTMYTLDAKTKSYRTIDQATVSQLGDRMGEARKKMDAQLAGMPPERRAMVEKMMGQMGGAGPPGGEAAKRVLKNTGRGETVAGIPCSVWEASVDGKKEEELCAAKPGSIPGGDEVVKTLKEIGEMLKGFTQGVGAIRRSGASEPWKDLETIKGVPILSRDFENGKVSSETRLLVARKQSVAGAQFEVPAGYTEKKLNFGAPPTE